MSFLSVLNNIHFAIEMIGAIAFGLVGWLAVDAFLLTRDFKTISRGIGFFLLALASLFHAASFTGDLYGYLTYALGIIGLLFVVANLIAEAPVERPEFRAGLFLPPLASALLFLHGAVFLGFAVVALLAYRQMRKEFKYALIPFIIAFVLLSVSALFPIFLPTQNPRDLSWIIEHVLRLLGFFALSAWVWSYLQLRIREELLLILIGTTLFMATVVSLAFSTILVRQLTQNTSDNLLVNARMLDASVADRESEIVAIAERIALSPGLGSMTARNDFDGLATLARAPAGLPGSIVTIVNKEGEVLVSSGLITRTNDTVSADPLFQDSLSGKASSAVARGAIEGFAVRAFAPIVEKGKSVGAVVVSYPLDNAFADGIKQRSGLDLSVYEGEEIVATTEFMDDGKSRLTGIRLSDSVVHASVLERGEGTVVSTTFGSRSAITAFTPLRGTDDKVVGMLGVSRLERVIIETMNITNRYTIVTVLLMMLILAFPLYVIARRLGGEVG